MMDIVITQALNNKITGDFILYPESCSPPLVTLPPLRNFSQNEVGGVSLLKVQANVFTTADLKNHRYGRADAQPRHISTSF